MKTSVLKTSRRSESRNDRSLGIQTWGEHNDYPQRCKEITNASGTAKACLRTYAKFIAGEGFTDKEFYQACVNTKAQTNDYLLTQLARDFADYHGFALHVNYNALYQVVEVQHVPFETIRFEKLDDNGHFTRLAVHPDWGRRTQALRRFRKEDIQLYHFYNSEPEAIEHQVDEAGGWEHYNGQILYYSESGEKTYPTPVYDAVITDASTEEGISNVKHRNARNSFMPSALIVDKRSKDESAEQAHETAQSLAEFQTDENACKLMLIQVESEAEVPVVMPIETKNYDEEFSYTETSVQQNIGRIFNQPPILRAEDVSAGFGADLIINAYSYYNAVTQAERLVLERVFQELYSRWCDKTINATNDFSLQPLRYTAQANITATPAEVLAVMTINEKRSLVGLPELTDSGSNNTTLAQTIGAEGVQAMLSIIADPAMTTEQKRNMLSLLFALKPKEVEQLVPSEEGRR